MADIQGVITLGTGPTTGSDIEHFVLVGLNANPSPGGRIMSKLAGLGGGLAGPGGLAGKGGGLAG